MAETKIEARPIWPTTLFFSHWTEHAKEAATIIQYLYEVRQREQTNIASGYALRLVPPSP